MSIEQSKVWQVIRYIDNINSSGESATQHVKTIAPHHEDGDFDEEEDSYNHLIEEDDDDEEEEEEDEDFISYDSESSTSAPSTLMDSSTAIIGRPPMMLDLGMAGSHDVRPEHSHLNHSHQHQMAQQHLQGSPRLVYVKLGDSPDHVITVNRPMGEELGRMLTSNGTVVNMTSTATVPEHLNITSTTTANDEELTSLTWLQDKNLIQGGWRSKLPFTVSWVIFLQALRSNHLTHILDSPIRVLSHCRN